MGTSINKVVITGNLTKDPELRRTSAGTPVLKMRVAVNDRRHNRETDQWEDVPNFINCTMFGSRAESLSRFLGKGAKVAIGGKLRWSSWEQDGRNREAVEVVVDAFDFMSSGKRAAAAEPQGTAGAVEPDWQPVQEGPVDTSVYDEDIPF